MDQDESNGETIIEIDWVHVEIRRKFTQIHPFLLNPQKIQSGPCILWGFIRNGRICVNFGRISTSTCLFSVIFWPLESSWCALLGIYVSLVPFPKKEIIYLRHACWFIRSQIVITELFLRVQKGMWFILWS